MPLLLSNAPCKSVITLSVLCMQCRQAAQLFLGRHDFTHFANVFPSEVDPHKTLTRFDLLELGCGQLRFEVEGSGFLYRQVRHMVRGPPRC